MKHLKMMMGAAALVTACAAPQRSRTLQTAEARLDSQKARQLSATQPQLVQEAESLAKAARRAEAKGDISTAELKAQQAIQRFETAASLDGRSAAEAQMRAMEAATGDLSNQVADLDRERDALAKFRDAEARFAAVEAQLAQVRADDQSARAQAQRAIVAARRKQAEAVGVKAPTLATEQYDRATTLLESALAALTANLNPDAKELAEQARDGFDESMRLADANAKSQADGLAETERAAGEAARQRAAAQDAIDAAEVARAAAVAQRLPQRDAVRFNQADAWLNMARARLKDGDFEKTVERANAATEAFAGKAELGDVDRAIQAAEEARARVIGLGLTDDPKAREADYTLQLARDAQAAGEGARAMSMAEKAAGLYQAVRPSAALAPAVAMVPGAGMVAVAAGAAPIDLGAAFEKYEVERALVRIRHAHADALAQGKDATCPPLFRGVEAFVKLAEERWQAGHHADAMQYVTRAGERLAQCGLTDASKADPLIATPKAAAKPTEPAKAAPSRGQLKAEASLAVARRMLIRAKTRKADALALEEPVMLLQEAQRWYDRAAFEQADNLADEATKLLRKVELPKPAPPKAAAASVEPKGTPAGTQTADAKTGTKTGTKADAKPIDPLLAAPKPGLLPRKGDPVPASPKSVPCPALQPALNSVQQARSQAAAQASTARKQADYVRALNMFASVEGLVKDERCDQAKPFLAEVDRLFQSVLAPVAQEPPAPAVAAAPATCAALDRPLQAALVAQGVASARVGAGERRRFEGAVGALVQAQQANAGGRCREAQGFLDQAVAGFDAVAAMPTTPVTAPAKPVEREAAPVKLAPTVSGTARAAIARAEALQLRARGQQTTSGYRTGARLLEKARDLANAGRGDEAQAVADQASFSFATLVEDADALMPQASGQSTEWKPVYAAILDTLVLRERARAAVQTDDERALLTSAERFMTKARAAWQAQDYLGAERFAKAAKVDLDKVLGMATARTGAPVEAPKPVKVEAPAPSVDPKVEADASALLRDVAVLRGRCMERGCAQSDAAAWANADAALTRARAAQKAGDWAAVNTHGAAARDALTAALETPTFTLSENDPRVRRVGNQLLMTPPITFTTGGGAIDPTTLPVVESLAQIIKRNQAAVLRLRIIGYTDSRGSERTNQRLSEKRAQTVRTALIDMGVPATLVVSEGMGEANPIASNKTAAGRERNRRVEFHLTVKQ